MTSAVDPASQLAAVVRAFVIHHARRHTSARIVNLELASLSDEHSAEIQGLRHQIDEEIRRLVDHGVQAGVFDTPNPRMAAAAVLSLGIDIARWYRDDGPWQPEQIADFYADLALRMVGAERD